MSVSIGEYGQIQQPDGGEADATLAPGPATADPIDVTREYVLHTLDRY